MREDIRGGGVAAGRLAEGASVRDVLDVGDPRAWVALDAGTRSWLRPDLLPTRAEIAGRPARLSALRRTGAPAEPRLALALCHRDGRVRETALEPAVGHPALWPLVVVRTTDWVPPVRERAREVLRAVLDDVDTAVTLAPLILLVGRRDRGAFGVDLLDEVLRRAPLERLASLLTHPDRAVRRFAYRLTVDEGHLSPAELARAAARDTDPVVQDLCAEAALAAVSEDGGYDDVLEPLLTARGPRVRSAGVTALRRAGRPDLAERFLADRSGLVRACARYVVRQSGGDPLIWYRRRCAVPGDPALPPGAVAGLAECGERADADSLWALLDLPPSSRLRSSRGAPTAPGVRARAVAGLRALDVTDVRPLRALLDDPEPRVVREATLALLPFARSLDADGLMERLAAGRPRHVRVAAFRLLDARGGLVRLRAAVALLDDPDVRLRHWAGQSVQGWHPTADVPSGSAEVGALLDRGRHLFSEYVLSRRKLEAGIGG
ncbi:hypothetical protein ADK57_31525 [Streptomyces sp. MMG1533]|uniref:hypothetical protein n=1 Tax=Streptomyces sp. MMG1533 TaxID=1415546 RepID=UPI0006AF41B4|nr:hypothetical protein [Streptomyces sp. MMG1533]KOU59947.1 hypothetical protein ADK57_31525 [Streptomyces sp. MMG1533]